MRWAQYAALQADHRTGNRVLVAIVIGFPIALSAATKIVVDQDEIDNDLKRAVFLALPLLIYWWAATVG